MPAATKYWLLKKLRPLSRAIDYASPLRVLRNWEWDGWDADGHHATWRFRVGSAVMWKLRIAGAICRAAFSRSSEDELMRLPFWQRGLYRTKAIACLLLGLHGGRWDGSTYMPMLEVAWWNGEMTGYYEPEWESSTLEVAYGLRPFCVSVHFREGSP